MDATIVYPLNVDELKKAFAEELAEALAYRYVYTDPTLRPYIYPDLDNIYIFIGAVKGRIAEEILRDEIDIDMSELREKLRYLIKSHSILSFTDVKDIDLTDKGVEIHLSISLGHILRGALSMIVYNNFLREEIIEKYKSFYEEERDRVLQYMRKQPYLRGESGRSD